jgi:hypothetical protein
MDHPARGHEKTDPLGLRKGVQENPVPGESLEDLDASFDFFGARSTRLGHSENAARA